MDKNAPNSRMIQTTTPATVATPIRVELPNGQIVEFDSLDDIDHEWIDDMMTANPEDLE